MCAPELFFDRANRGRRITLCFRLCVRVRVCFFYSVRQAVCADAGGDAGKHTHICRRYLSLRSHTAFLSCCYLGSTVAMATKDVSFGVGGVLGWVMRLGCSSVSQGHA